MKNLIIAVIKQFKAVAMLTQKDVMVISFFQLLIFSINTQVIIQNRAL